MDQEPDRSEAHWQGHFGTFDGAHLFVCMVESISAAEGEPIPRTEVTQRP